MNKTISPLSRQDYLREYNRTYRRKWRQSHLEHSRRKDRERRVRLKELGVIYPLIKPVKLCTTCGKQVNYRSKTLCCKSCSHKGLVRSEETRKKISEGKLGSNNPAWKGDNVSYKSLHEWVGIHKLKPPLCEICKAKPPYDLANISQRYLRDLSDWEWLCRRCHMTKDGRLLALHPKGGK